ncbi:MAG: SWIM zinc finger family protein [Alphaproteobacteria bacterium]|nr:SWIM zinc finger family protein [Alphaproteobacteria bacterium]
MRLYTLDDIVGAVSSRYFDRGRGYHRRKLVSDVEFLEDGRLVTGATQGSRARAYDQHVEIHVGPRGTEIIGSCTCPIGFNCKHVVAVVLEGLSRPEGRDLGPGHALGVDPALGVWLGELEEATRERPGDDFPPDVRWRLIYVLRTETTVSGGVTARMQLFSVRLLKDGRFGTNPSTYNAGNIVHGVRQPPGQNPACRSVHDRDQI